MVILDARLRLRRQRQRHQRRRDVQQRHIHKINNSEKKKKKKSLPIASRCCLDPNDYFFLGFLLDFLENRKDSRGVTCNAKGHEWVVCRLLGWSVA